MEICETHMTTEVHIDKEFSALCPPLTMEELNYLESSLERDGCRDPLCTWQENGKPLLLDGHNRYAYCKRNKAEFKTRTLKFASREEARNWVIANQLGRRNLTEDQKSYLRGKRYIAERKPLGGHPKPENLNPQNADSRTSVRLGQEYGVNHTTIERDAKFAAAVDTIAANAGEKARREILSGELQVTKQDVVKLAELPPSQQKVVVSGGREKIRKATASKRKQAPRFDDEAFLPLCEQLEAWLTRRFDKAGGAEARDECAKLLGQFKRSVEQWQKHKPL